MCYYFTARKIFLNFTHCELRMVAAGIKFIGLCSIVWK